jgi:hypothetical protein
MDASEEQVGLQCAQRGGRRLFVQAELDQSITHTPRKDSPPRHDSKKKTPPEGGVFSHEAVGGLLFRRVADGVTRALDILAGAGNRVAASQDHRKDNQRRQHHLRAHGLLSFI